MAQHSLYHTALAQLREHPIVTVAAGTTCACLGDERNLREFIVADETAKRLRQAGHLAFSLLIDDSFDPLNERQLRIAMNKDPEMVRRYSEWCGKPIGLLPDPWGCHESYAAHFEQALLDRLHHLGCHPTLVSTAGMYQRGQYAPYIRIVLEQYDEILAFLADNFRGYQPEKLVWPLCPHCECMDETRILSVQMGTVQGFCARCSREFCQTFDEIRVKLNWKLDCAARWRLLGIHAEPFNKAYLEPQTGTFTIAQALSRKFFEGTAVHPLRYGLVKMERNLSYKLLQTLPPDMLRSLLADKPEADLNLTSNLVLTTATRYKVLPGMSYQDAIRQLLPIWLFTPEKLSPRQRELLASGIAFSREFFQTELQLRMPRRADFVDAPVPILCALDHLLQQTIMLRGRAEHSWEIFCTPIKETTNALGEIKHATVHLLRSILGQEQGPPVARMLFLLPLDYIVMLESMIHMFVLSLRETWPHPAISLAA